MTTDLDPIIRERLDGRVPAPSPESADWDDVVARATRAEAPPRPRWRLSLSRRNVLIGIAAAAVLTGFAVAHSRVFQLVGINEQASGPSAEALVRLYPWPHGLRVLIDRSRVIFEDRVPVDFDHNGPTRTSPGVGFVAPLSNGQLCLAEVYGPGQISSCLKPGGPRLVWLSLSPMAWMDGSGREHLGPFVLWGVAPKATRHVTLVGPGNTVTRVPLSPIAIPGHVAWALHVPKRMLTPGGRPAALVARNASGTIIARANVTPSQFTPVIYNRPIPAAKAHNPRPAVNTKALVSVRIGRALHTFSLSIDQGSQCLFDKATVGTKTVFSSEYCGPPTTFAPDIQPVHNRAAVGWGLAPAGTKTVTVVYATHFSPAVVTDGYYIFTVPTVQLRNADLPLRVQARNAQGAAIATHALTDKSMFPGY